ncbi:hypothetical protein RZE82_02115 [Mollicutes bacterium LVI A0039]|nr:hypothetical protein RZE82_02115 [Mollicutes bacterium LVI A0039]
METINVDRNKVDKISLIKDLKNVVNKKEGINVNSNSGISNNVTLYFDVNTNEVLIEESSVNELIEVNRTGEPFMHKEDLIANKKDMAACNYIEYKSFSRLKYLLSECV